MEPFEWDYQIICWFRCCPHRITKQLLPISPVHASGDLGGPPNRMTNECLCWMPSNILREYIFNWATEIFSLCQVENLWITDPTGKREETISSCLGKQDCWFGFRYILTNICLYWDSRINQYLEHLAQNRKSLVQVLVMLSAHYIRMNSSHNSYVLLLQQAPGLGEGE